MINLIKAMDEGTWVWAVSRDSRTRQDSLFTGIIKQVYPRDDSGRRLAYVSNSSSSMKMETYAENLFYTRQEAVLTLLDIPPLAAEEQAVICLMKEHGVKCYYDKDFGIWMEDRIVEQIPLQPIEKLRNLEDMKARASCPKDTGAE